MFKTQRVLASVVIQINRVIKICVRSNQIQGNLRYAEMSISVCYNCLQSVERGDMQCKRNIFVTKEVIQELNIWCSKWERQILFESGVLLQNQQICDKREQAPCPGGEMIQQTQNLSDCVTVSPLNLSRAQQQQKMRIYVYDLMWKTSAKYIFIYKKTFYVHLKFSFFLS